MSIYVAVFASVSSANIFPFSVSRIWVIPGRFDMVLLIRVPTTISCMTGLVSSSPTMKSKTTVRALRIGSMTSAKVTVPPVNECIPISAAKIIAAAAAVFVILLFIIILLILRPTPALCAALSLAFCS